LGEGQILVDADGVGASLVVLKWELQRGKLPEKALRIGRFQKSQNGGSRVAD